MIAPASEEWRPIQWPPISGYYEVSSFGRVRRAAGGQGTRAGREMMAFKAGLYPAVKLTVRQKDYRATVYVHDLVATAFIGPKSPGMEVNHKNFDKFDNCITNLEYTTRQENIAHATNAGRFGGAKLTPERVREIRRLHASGVSNTTLAFQYDVDRGTIWHITTWKTWKHLRESEIAVAEVPSEREVA